MTKAQIVTTLIDEWSSIDTLLADLPTEQWTAPTSLPGWTVQDVVAHIVGAELGLSGKQPPIQPDVSAYSHVRNEIGAVNECWVEWMRSQSPAEVLRRFREITATRAEALTAMSEEDFSAPSWTPAGQGTYARFMQIRVFDCWMHEQDIREAVDRRGNESGAGAELSIDEITLALGYIVGKKAKAPQGSSVTFNLNGPVNRQIHVAINGRAAVVPSLPGPATASLTMSSTVFTRMAGGRIPTDVGFDQTEPKGDRDLAEHVAFALTFTI
ncbi:maleylpyruvate isomerase family mycothiol-dependent enzyme [Kibdelosporangium philippinense]|uniref:Maleylpyruvate isomerase family mycothiol-dependent enzyme n=1 Tax=Kibdelosporangium philippinense TaxID=211113 RepID=A0ABS8ZXF6_9PSEU|nr:maleylpyruvate isomerase family mycothiol-dependent enzyme [Kibdelosporangium philippinense]MCE7011396.1 maleylpyruvate isomerase family mycothiol-dependent enzyme [Kibdelosporangium philippinense]